MGGINSVVTSIGEYQSVDVGGFQINKYSAPTLEDTTDALFLSSLFGLSDKINLVGVSKFVQSLRNLDGGYCNQPGSISDVVSVKNAILSLSYLESSIDEKQTTAIASFLETLYDENSKLFSYKKGVVGDIRSTALAFECYQRLGLADSASVVSKKNALRTFLQGLVKSDNGKKYFYSITADNAHAVIAASFVGFEFDGSWAKYFEERQVQEGFWKGGFYSDSDRVDVTPQDAKLAVLALNHLQKQLVSSIDTSALVAYSNALPADLRTAAQVYEAISKSSGFSSLFKLEPVYTHKEARHRVLGSRIVQGSLIKPSLVVKSNFGISQGSLKVSAEITHDSNVQVVNLFWDAENQIYIGEEYFSAEKKLGPVSFDYVVQWEGENNALRIKSQNQLLIGYWSNVKLKATYGGQDIEPGTGAIVDQGASFSIAATYGTVENKPNSPLKTGNFDVIFSVLDSSESEISRTVLDAKKGKPFKFNHLLDVSEIPPGILTLRVSVQDKTKDIVHTVDSFTFVVQSQIVASSLKFVGDKSKYKVGDKVEVSMVPANLPEVRVVRPLRKVARSMILNVQSSESQVLFTVPGVFNAGEYKFDFVVDSTFESIGVHSVTFTYKAANGDEFPLKLFNSATKYLYDVGETFSYSVDTQLTITDSKSALKEGKLEYGNDVKLSFKVFDEVSKKNIWAGSKDSTAYLVLQHNVGQASAFTSIRHAASQIQGKNNEPSHFSVDWSVNPNALKGPATLALVVQAADGTDVELVSGGKPWSVNVDIGGDITTTQKTHSGKLNNDLVSFLVEFELTCQQKKTKRSKS